MNCLTQSFDFTVEDYQISNVVTSVFQSILLHRTLGKFEYKEERVFSVGTIGCEDVDCGFIDFTYVRCSSSALAKTLSHPIDAFERALRDRRNNTEKGLRGPEGEISLEFYTKKSSTWPFATECVPWEVWTIRLGLKTILGEIERQINRTYLGEMVGEKVVLITDVINRQQYLPKTPGQSEVEDIFDTSFPDIQPYLFRITHSTTPLSPSSSTSFPNTLRRMFREALSF